MVQFRGAISKLSQRPITNSCETSREIFHFSYDRLDLCDLRLLFLRSLSLR